VPNIKTFDAGVLDSQHVPAGRLARLSGRSLPTAMTVPEYRRQLVTELDNFEQAKARTSK